MNVPITPELLELGIARLGVMFGQFRNVERATVKQLVRFVMDGLATGDMNAYLKSALTHLEERDREGDTVRPPPPEPARRTASSGKSVAEATFEEPRPRR